MHCISTKIDEYRLSVTVLFVMVQNDASESMSIPYNHGPTTVLLLTITPALAMSQIPRGCTVQLLHLP